MGSQTVWKYPLQGKTSQEVEMPWGARILKLAVIGTTPCLWVLVDPRAPSKKIHEFCMYQTGEEIPDPEQLEYIGTIAAEQDDKPMVIHCFEKLRIIV